MDELSAALGCSQIEHVVEKLKKSILLFS